MFNKPANSRFTDNPFRQPGLPDESLAWLEQRNLAIKLYRETGDTALAEEIGLFWNSADEERARAAQRLRFSDDPFSGPKLTNEQMAERFQPIIEWRTKEQIKEMVSLFKPIVRPYPVYRGMRGPLLTSDGHEAQVGDELWIDGFMSASRDPKFAAWCAVEEFGTESALLEILPVPDAETITLDNEIDGRSEYESIFNAGQKVRVDRVVPDFKADFYPLKQVSSFFVGTLMPG